MEKALQEKDEKLAECTEKFNKLKEDFKYNLKLLKDRDDELESYDSNVEGLNGNARDQSAFWQ